MTEDKEPEEIVRVNCSARGNCRNSEVGEREQRAKGTLIKQCSRRLALRWRKWLRGFLGMEMSNRGSDAAGVLAIHKSLLLAV